MRKVLVNEWMSLDGVVQSAGAVDPVAIGGGKRVSRYDGELKPLLLVDHQVATTGAIFATYARARG